MTKKSPRLAAGRKSGEAMKRKGGRLDLSNHRLQSMPVMRIDWTSQNSHA